MKCGVKSAMCYLTMRIYSALYSHAGTMIPSEKIIKVALATFTACMHVVLDRLFGK